jgi:APA family basic amino acid/polyamine antiporter
MVFAAHFGIKQLKTPFFAKNDTFHPEPVISFPQQIRYSIVILEKDEVMQDAEATLKRALSLPLVTFYGLGTILGAGIYVLVGKVAGAAGMYMPLAFLLASVVALFTGISYAELGSRYPVSAGEAYYVKRAFNKTWLSGIVGWMVVFTGIVSTSTLAHGFVGYARVFLHAPDWVLIVGFICSLSLVAMWGILESAMLALIITLIEVGGLLMVLFIARADLATLPQHFTEMIPPMDVTVWAGIYAGAFLAFYSFIGFEDIVNVAEEVKHPEKNLPRAIFWALGLATVMYILVAMAAVLALPVDELAGESAPLAHLVASKGYSPAIIGMIGLISIMNGALVQIIMASRVIYGMGKQNNAPAFLSLISGKTRTPLVATGFVMAIIIVFALWLPIVTLAKTTSAVILCVFIMIHLALIKVKLMGPPLPESKSYSIVFPIVGVLLSIAFLLAQLGV